MGTRALINIFNDDVQVACIYRQFDGYVSGLGADLAAILKGRTFVNGISGDRCKVFNGMGCFAAQCVKQLKEDAGNVYLYPAGSSRVGEEFVYEFRGSYETPRKVLVTVFGYDKQLFSGDVDGFLAFVEQPETEES